MTLLPKNGCPVNALYEDARSADVDSMAQIHRIVLWKQLK